MRLKIIWHFLSWFLIHIDCLLGKTELLWMEENRVITSKYTNNNNKKAPSQTTQMINGLVKWKQFSKDETQMAKKQHMEKCLASTAIREMQIKTALKSHLLPVRMDVIKKTTDSSQGSRQADYSSSPPRFILVSPPGLQQTTCCSILLLSASISRRPHRSSPAFLSTPLAPSGPSSSRLSLGILQSRLPEKQGDQWSKQQSFRASPLLSSTSSSQVQSSAL